MKANILYKHRGHFRTAGQRVIRNVRTLTNVFGDFVTVGTYKLFGTEVHIIAFGAGGSFAEASAETIECMTEEK